MATDILKRRLLLAVCFTSTLISFSQGVARADDLADYISTVRIAAGITGGELPANSPEFQQMLSLIKGSKDYYAAAMVAAGTKYAIKHLGRKFAKESQNVSLDSSIVPDNDSTTLIIANLFGAGGATANISKVWSDYNTYSYKVTRAGVVTNVKAMDVTAAEMAALDLRTDLTRVSGQMAIDRNNAAIVIPLSDSGGAVTANDRANDASIAQNGFTAGTNLRAIEYFYQVAMGMTLTSLAGSDGPAQNAPKFVPESDPNFFHGLNQPACLSCHGAGVPSLDKGYSTLAQRFDFNPNRGLVFTPTVTAGQDKSISSDPTKRGVSLNPDSIGVDPNRGYNLSLVWQSNGNLDKLGWKAPTVGQGLNSFGIGVGKATATYATIVRRLIQTLCPTGTVDDSVRAQIADEGYMRDDFKHMIARVAEQPACR